MRSSVFLVAAGALLTSGCFSYQPTRLEAVGPGETIRVRISPEEADRLVDVRLTDDRLVSGILVSNGGDGLLLDTTVGVNDPARGTRALTQRITIPVGEVREVEMRRVNWFKTGVVGGAIAVGVGVVAAAALAGGGGSPDPGGGGGVEIVVPRGFNLGWRVPFPGF
jgi:hypothetical protein